MAVFDSNMLVEYPFYGEFYTIGIDESKPLDEQVEEEIMVLKTDCDIQDGGKGSEKFIGNIYSVYFPFTSNIAIKNGYMFRGYMYGLEIAGTILGISPSQLSGCKVFVGDKQV